MSRTTHTNRNLAARMGRWSAESLEDRDVRLAGLRPRRLRARWHGRTRTIDNAAGPGESGRMDRILEAGFDQPAAEHVLIQSRSARAGTPAFDAAVADVVAGISKLAVVRDIRSPLTPGNADHISEDGRSALVEFKIRGAKDEAVDKIDPVLDAVAAAQLAHPDFSIGEFGNASAENGVATAYEDYLGKAGTLSLPITPIVLGSRWLAVAAGISRARADGRLRDLRSRCALERACRPSRCRHRRWCS